MADDVWEASEQKLHKASIAAIRRFTKEHPDTEVCCWFFDCDDPQYGHVFISLDTPDHNVESA